MSIPVPATASDKRPANGGRPARRAVIRWAWRLFRTEWRQQSLILALITFAVAATIVGSALATDTPPSKNAGFGTADDAATFASADAQTLHVISSLEHRFGKVQQIDTETETVPGSVDTFELLAQDPHGPFGGPMLSLLSGTYPTSAAEVAVTRSVASDFHLSTGGSWDFGGTRHRVVGIVENPQSLLESFALVPPGQVRNPTQVVALFDAPGIPPHSIGPEVSTPASAASANPLNPETISLAALVLGMLLIALVSVGGFTVLAQRRLRSIGLLASTGATDRHVRLVVRANGTVVGVVGAALGLALGFVLWLAYRPSLEQSAHHVLGVTQLPWAVVVAAIVLAIVATTFAASRPAKAISKIPIVAALSGRPAPPRQVRRSAVPGIVFLVVAFLLLGYSGGTNNGTGSGGTGSLALGIILLIPGLILLSPFLLSLAARMGRRAPISARLALRDLARYRARSGSALSAISVGVLVAVIVILAAASRYGNVLDWAGPNLAPNEIALHANVQINRATGNPVPVANAGQVAAHAAEIARGLGAQLVGLESPNAEINYPGTGRNWYGNIYVATPQLLKTFGIKPSEIDPNADILSARPGLSGDSSSLRFIYGTNKGGPGGGPPDAPDCTAATNCLADPAIQEIGALPLGTSAPNTVITEHAISEFHIGWTTTDWLVQGTQAFTAGQISNAQALASTSGLSVESRNDIPSSDAVLSWATIFGLGVALGVLGLSVGLVRSETASDLRTLAATGASSFTRRALTAVTAGALGFLGALLGTVGGYVGLIGWLRGNSLNGGISSLANVPVRDLLIILVGMPAFAAVVGWLLAGREPPAMGQQPIQ